jgi:hypothetical protein
MLMASWLAVSAVLLALGWFADVERQTSPDAGWWSWYASIPANAVVWWVNLITTAVVLLAMGHARHEPRHIAWPVSIVAGSSVVIGALAWWSGRGVFCYVSGLLVNLVGLLFWLAWVESTDANLDLMDFADPALQRFLLIQTFCLAVASLAWSLLEMSRRSIGLGELSSTLPPFRHAAAWLGVLMLTALAGYALVLDLTGKAWWPMDWWLWVAIPAILASVCAKLWDRPGQHWSSPLPQLYLLGLTLLALNLHDQQWTIHWLFFACAASSGAYVLATSALLLAALHFSSWRRYLALPVRPDGWPLGWFPIAQVMLATTCLVLSAVVILTYDELWARLGVALAICCLPASYLLVVRCESRRARPFVKTGPESKRWIAVVLAVLAVVALHLALISPSETAPWLDRSAMVLIAMTWMSLVSSLLARRFKAGEPGENAMLIANHLAAILWLLAAIFLVLTLVQEFVHYNPAEEVRRSPMQAMLVGGVALAMIVLVAWALRAALSPARDYLQLSEQGRTAYVYAAEVLVVLLLMHLRWNVPDYFEKYLGQFWVFAVMAVAFLGVGVSELCQRRGLHILGGPLQQTAMFLPLLPLVAFLIRPFKDPLAEFASGHTGLSPLLRYLDRLPDDYRSHAAVWFLMGLLYLVVALSKRSSNLALTAAVLANFGLWVLLGHQSHLAFMAHPQLWLIPIGLIILAAEIINRARLLPAQALALRYTGMLVIYVSSSADMFIAGLGHNVLLPIALAVLSVVGVLLGILLRVRAFLILGLTFLFLVVFAQIWHAAVDRGQTWIWWVTGIVLGVAILALFALFEKRRNAVLKVIDDMKRWR